MVKRRIGIFALLFCLFLCLLPCSASAINTEKECILALTYAMDGEAIQGAPLKLYKVAEISADGEYTLVPALRSSRISLEGMQSQSEWEELRSTLEGYLIATAAKPDFEAVTDQGGQATVRGLKAGLYMVESLELMQGGRQYFFASALVALPGIGANGNWQYQVSVNPKGEILPPIEPDEELEMQVLKLWKGDAAGQRPKSIEVEIFRNGESFRKVTLSQENQWSYRWVAKADGASWKVVERNVPGGYTMTVEERGTTFVVTNTYGGQTPPNRPPNTGNGFNLPLYILLMNLSGIVLILLGLAGRRRREG